MTPPGEKDAAQRLFEEEIADGNPNGDRVIVLTGTDFQELQAELAVADRCMLAVDGGGIRVNGGGAEWTRPLGRVVDAPVSHSPLSWPPR